jgi:hypothetical protein
MHSVTVCPHGVWQIGGKVLPGIHGAQRASRRRSLISPAAVALIATLFAAGGLLTDAQPAEAGGRKVVIVVGPVGGQTAHYKDVANNVARRARAYGANVIKIYSPYATWSRVKYHARNANLLVYLGHGNGWPSPYSPFQTLTKNGFGLNASSGNGNYNVKYYGERYVASSIDLAADSVVLFMRLCYASGNSEPGRANPSLSVAKQRVDNYGSGFLRTGARAVISEGVGSADYILYGLFKTNRTMRQIFWSAPNAHRTYATTFNGDRTPSWARGIMDPTRPGSYYRSIVGELDMTAGEWR